jgi:hypothetical protein
MGVGHSRSDRRRADSRHLHRHALFALYRRRAGRSITKVKTRVRQLLLILVGLTSVSCTGASEIHTSGSWSVIKSGGTNPKCELTTFFLDERRIEIVQNPNMLYVLMRLSIPINRAYDKSLDVEFAFDNAKSWSATGNQSDGIIRTIIPPAYSPLFLSEFVAHKVLTITPQGVNSWILDLVNVNDVMPEMIKCVEAFEDEGQTFF